MASAEMQVKTKAESQVGDFKVQVESDQPGSIDLRVKDQVVRIETSQGLTPTIFIRSKKNISPTVVTIPPKQQEERHDIFLEILFKKFFNFFLHFKKELDKVRKLL